MHPPIFRTSYAVLHALLRQQNSYYKLSVHVPGDRWITHEDGRTHAVRFNNGTTENVLFRGNAHQIVEFLFGKEVRHNRQP
jgi:hypothetical protein